MPQNPSDPAQFAEVFAAELKHVDRRRQRHRLSDDHHLAAADGEVPKLEDLQKAAHKRQLVGLAFSGGGIRSATFNLGFLQGLAKLRLLKLFDFLSTVSGGGYIGAWWIAWIAKTPALQVEEQLRPDCPRTPATPRREPIDPIEYVRRHSNYLAPCQGFLSTDHWVLLATYLRNFLFSQFILIPAAMLALMVSRVLLLWYYPILDQEHFLYREDGHRVGLPLDRFGYYVAAVAILILIGLASVFAGVRSVRVSGKPPTFRTSLGRCWGLVVVIVFTFLAAAVFFCALVPNPVSLPELQCLRWISDSIDAFLPEWLPGLAAFIMGSAIAVCVGWCATYRWVWIPLWVAVAAVAFLCITWGTCGTFGLFQKLGWQSVSLPSGWLPWFASMVLFLTIGITMLTLTNQMTCRTWFSVSWPLFGWTLLAVVFWGCLLFGTYRLLYWFSEWDPNDPSEPMMAIVIAGTAHLTIFGPPLLLFTVVLSLFFAVGLFREHVPDLLREWCASLCGWLLLISAFWTVVNLASLYVTPLILWAGPWVRAGLVSGWLFTVVGAVFAGGSHAPEA